MKNVLICRQSSTIKGEGANKGPFSLCVHESAGLPDLTTCRVGDVAHLDHGVRELLEEQSGVSPVLVDRVGRRVPGDAGPHLLVGVEEALALDERLEIGVVEGRGSVAVHGADVVVATIQGADLLELAEVGRRRRVVLGCHLEVAVYPVPEVRAPGESNCVGSFNANVICLVGNARYRIQTVQVTK